MKAKKIHKEIIKYVEDNKLEDNYHITYVNIQKVARLFKVDEIEVMFALRYCR